ncbi:flagellar motor protein [Sporolactobacillus terrae]|uniref:Motility protein A n=1 Tax=Sporolactobacillus terrae TaxID=269673 RepID=A0A410D731_9BACL|nr:flagellar motor protein [Sporolactobacillus terrae]QAA21924.1 motility protein A [Sporolactobacillus terrae]QAA24897.1 motility protein A [Sporolactobacillus terrae]UAK16717.1 flagellar motor protein [Sporolactobacillus terrae]BBN98201.1 motility protein A [Sporolactobacillus terrae]
MDVATVIGLLVGLLSLVVGFLLEGGELIALLKITAFLIVFGGTIGAVIVSFPGKVLAKVPFILKYAFQGKKERPSDTVVQLIHLANVSRREGLLALEGEQDSFEKDPFMSNGIQMVVDGVDSDAIDDILNRDIELYEQKILSIGRIFESAGGYAPTMGIIGTVMGLVHVLGSLENATELGPAIAVAFIATLYGVGSANVIYLPLYTKIKNNLASEVMIRQLKTEGILSIQYGENTMILKKKLYAFLSEDECRKVEQQLSSDNGDGAASGAFQEAGQL